MNQNRIDFLEMTSKANHEKLGEKPDSDAWNALEIMEHVMVSEFGTLGYMKKKMSGQCRRYSRCYGGE